MPVCPVLPGCPASAHEGPRMGFNIRDHIRQRVPVRFSNLKSPICTSPNDTVVSLPVRQLYFLTQKYNSGMLCDTWVSFDASDGLYGAKNWTAAEASAGLLGVRPEPFAARN